MPAVSVIIPVYDVEQFIARCARSLFEQTLQDVEFIFIDDCTPDHSIDVMQKVLEEYPGRKEQVVVYRMSHNSGQAKVRMQGISLATGDYVINCDSDDEVNRDAYRIMYEKAVAEGLDTVTCNYMVVKEDGGRTLHSLYAPCGKEIDDILWGKIMGALWGRMFRRTLLTNLVPPVGNMTEDVLISIQALCHSERIGYVQEPLYYYYLRNSSISLASGKDADIVRWKAFYANSRLLVEILTERYGYDVNSSSLIFFKYRTRAHLQKYVHIPECYKMWRNTFPEIDRRFIFTPGIPFDAKIWFVLIHLHLYHPWKVITGKA